MRPTRILPLLAATVAIVACGSDNTGTNPGGGGNETPIVYKLALGTTMVDSISVTVATVVPVTVHLTQAGTAVAGTMVHWNVLEGDGKPSSDSTATDANGDATVQWTLGNTAGFNTLSATAFNASASYHATGVAGPPSNLQRVTADSSAVVAGASLPLFVRAVDALGNGTSGVDITWSASAGQLTLTTTAAGSKGGASTVYTPPSTPGTYTVTATLPGKAAVTFTIVAL
jgi:hypothetical protein